MFVDNLIFIHPPRCGGTSIEESFKWRNEFQKHLSAKTVRRLFGEDRWLQSFKFSIVRNPFDRVISMYHAGYYKSIKRGVKFESLESFLTSIPKVHSEEGIQCSDFINEEVDYIIRFEDRDRGLDELYEKYNIKIDKTIHIRQTGRQKDYTTYHTPSTIELVKLHFKDDINNFNYIF